VRTWYAFGNPVFLLALMFALAPEVLRVSVPAPAPVPQASAVELSLTIVDPALMPGLPIGLRLSSEQMELRENRFDERDVVDVHAAQPRLRARIIAPEQAGRYVVRGQLAYVTCLGSSCRSQEVSVQWVIEVFATPEIAPSQPP